LEKNPLAVVDYDGKELPGELERRLKRDENFEAF
jgi:hypothetical protein